MTSTSFCPLNDQISRHCRFRFSAILENGILSRSLYLRKHYEIRTICGRHLWIGALGHRRRFALILNLVAAASKSALEPPYHWSKNSRCWLCLDFLSLGFRALAFHNPAPTLEGAVLRDPAGNRRRQCGTTRRRQQGVTIMRDIRISRCGALRREPACCLLPPRYRIAFAEDAPKKGGRLIVAADSEPRNLNPAIVASNGVFFMSSKVVEPLAEASFDGPRRADRALPPPGKARPTACP